MIHKKPSGLISTYNGLNNVCCSSPSQSASSSRHQTRYSKTPRPWQARGYATLINDSFSRQNDCHHWPEPPKGHKHPTPYQICNLKRGAPYTKHRFYELAKLYHPDRNDFTDNMHTLPNHVSKATKLERYRLIVAAHTILSDPVKRSAYDHYGAGWNGHPEVGAPQHDRPGPFTPGSGATWRAGHSPMGNATWEDWERWYQRDERSPQMPTYISNFAFVSLVVMLAALGGIGNATRAESYSMNFLEQRDRMHDQNSKELRRVRQDTAMQKDKDERIQRFLRMRDATHGINVEQAREETYRRLLPEPEICSSENIHSRSMENYQQPKPNR
ncbi:hypothetical protein LTR04_000458 [Oleoguttula sp. CCFEE 6159]|nr:hypothetical protein LTR04_000458 [Oleoguttula sp. CCFEE 6159]